MNYPKEIWADTDLVCGVEPSETHQKYVRADSTFEEYVLDTIGTTDMACVLGLIRAASELLFCRNTICSKEEENKNEQQARENLVAALAPFGSPERLPQPVAAVVERTKDKQ